MSKFLPGSFVLHHGSDCDFALPKWNAGDKHKDFGQCFYTTYDQNLAKVWAEQKTFNPRVYHYCLSLKNIHDCDLKIKRFDVDAEWARFIYNNRYNESFVRPDYDIIIGPIADSKITRIFALMDLEGKSFDDIAPLLKFDKFNRVQWQVGFCSEKSLQLLYPISLK